MISTLPMWGSEVANSKTEINLTNTAGEVGMRCHIYAMSPLMNARVTLLRQAYATVFRRGCLTWACNGLVVWFTAILTYLLVVLAFLIINIKI